MALGIAKDHWAFLDEIEAPMWVDLSLEAKSNYQDIDDGWFQTSHLFHQLPSLKLKAAFAHSGDGSASSNIDSKGPSSPKLPSSVSRSRGKHYRSKKQKEDQHVFPLNKQHPVKALSGKSSWVKSGSREEIKPPKVSFINSEGTSRSKKSFVVDRNFTGNAKENYFKAISSHEDSKGSLSCMEDKQGDSNRSTITSVINSKGTSRSKRSFVVERNLTGNAKENDFKAISSHEDSKGSLSYAEDKPGDSNTSTITTESDQKLQQKNLETSSRAFGHSSGLLSAIRISLRKSCVTRPASRVDVSNRRQSRDCNSVSGKSSVGSSSNPGYDIKNSSFVLKQQREQTPDSRKEATTVRATKNKLRESAMSKASNVQEKDVSCNSRRRGTRNVSKPAYHNAVKTKVAKALTQHRVNEQRLLNGPAKANEKVTVCGWSNRLVGAGYENTTVRVPANQKFHGGDITSGVMAKGQKGTKQDAPPRKGDKTRLTVPKEKASSANRGKHPTAATQRLYLR